MLYITLGLSLSLGLSAEIHPSRQLNTDWYELFSNTILSNFISNTFYFFILFYFSYTLFLIHTHACTQHMHTRTHARTHTHTHTHTHTYNDVTGYGFFTAATYGTRCPAHEYGMTPKGGVPYSCAGHRVPYVAAVKDPYLVNGFLYALGISLI